MKRKRKNFNTDGLRYVDLVSKPEKRWYHKRKRKIEVGVFAAVMFLGLIVSFIIPLRPAVSNVEKRNLASFPEFSVQSLFNGSYFKGIDTWFSDTFPFREGIIGLNSKLNFWYGFGNKVSSLNNDVADDIPDVPATTDEDETGSDDTTAQSTTEQVVSTEPVSEEHTSSASGTTSAQDKPSDKTSSAPAQTQTLGGILISGKSGYEYYNFIQSTADNYAKHIRRIAKKVSEKDINVYDMIVPTSIDIVLDEATRRSVNTSNQQKAIEYISSSMGKNVKTVNIFNVLKEHCDEYIYFRTDHHWTALGAYYAYTEFAKAKGFTPVDIKKFKKIDCGDFLGSFYTDTNSTKMKKNPDKLIAYVPNYSTSLTYTNKGGSQINWPIVYDVSSYPENLKYSAFAGGDNPYTKIINNDMKKGPNCIVVKESFGNAVIPFIAGNYRKVYVIDYRYWDGKLSELAEEKGVDDIIFINNISATRSNGLVEEIGSICY